MNKFKHITLISLILIFVSIIMITTSFANEKSQKSFSLKGAYFKDGKNFVVKNDKDLDVKFNNIKIQNNNSTLELSGNLIYNDKEINIQTKGKFYKFDNESDILIADFEKVGNYEFSTFTISKSAEGISLLKPNENIKSKNIIDILIYNIKSNDVIALQGIYPYKNFYTLEKIGDDNFNSIEKNKTIKNENKYKNELLSSVRGKKLVLDLNNSTNDTEQKVSSNTLDNDNLSLNEFNSDLTVSNKNSELDNNPLDSIKITSDGFSDFADATDKDVDWSEESPFREIESNRFRYQSYLANGFVHLKDINHFYCYDRYMPFGANNVYTDIMYLTYHMNPVFYKDTNIYDSKYEIKVRNKGTVIYYPETGLYCYATTGWNLGQSIQNLTMFLGVADENSKAILILRRCGGACDTEGVTDWFANAKSIGSYIPYLNTAIDYWDKISEFYDNACEKSETTTIHDLGAETTYSYTYDKQLLDYGGAVQSCVYEFKGYELNQHEQNLHIYTQFYIPETENEVNFNYGFTLTQGEE